MTPPRETWLWSVLACLALFLLVLWWNGSGEGDHEGMAFSAAGTREAAGSAPRRGQSRRPLGDWSFGEWRQEPPAEDGTASWEIEDVEDAVRRTFLAYNAEDLPAFKAGWTGMGFREAYGLPKENATSFGLLSLLSFRPYTIGEFSNTGVYGKSAATEVRLTHGEVQERHRLSLVWEEDAWKIDQDEKLVLIPEDATVVDAKIEWDAVELRGARVVQGSVAFRITNADKRAHEFVVKRVTESESEETIGMTKPLPPGESDSLVLTDLGPGRYVILCNLLGPDDLVSFSRIRAEFTIE